MSNSIPLSKPYFDQDELAEIKKVLASGWVSQGPKGEEFEKKIAQYLGVNYAIAVTNCTSALHLSLLSIGIKKGDEVLVADYTFPATGHSVLYCGAKPVFIDINLKTYNMDPASICGKITEKTKAIIPVHTFGQSAEMDIIKSIANEHDLKIIEDAACALGAKYNNKYAGTIGDIGCFSLHARKGITTGEGGIVVTNNGNLANKIKSLSVFGMASAWDRERIKGLTIPQFKELGFNYKMSDILSAVGVAQLKKLKNIIDIKQKLARYWDERLVDVPLIVPPYRDSSADHIYQSYVALVDESINRNKLISILRTKGVQANIGTYASHMQPIYNSKDECPNSLDIFNRALALPMYYGLRNEDIDASILCIKESIEGLK